VQLDDGRQIAAELLLVGIGVLPDLDLAASAGIEAGNGILVDAMMQSSVQDIFAIGDVALIDGAALRIESVDNAQMTAARAAAAICGLAQPAMAAPWFWSEQFDVRLQSAGIVPLASPDLRHQLRPENAKVVFPSGAMATMGNWPRLRLFVIRRAICLAKNVLILGCRLILTILAMSILISKVLLQRGMKNELSGRGLA